jgi:hypothetical protein
MLNLPKELLNLLCKPLSSSELEKLMKTCKRLCIMLRMMHKSVTREELTHSVFQSKPFFPAKLISLTKDDEMKVYESSVNFRYEICLQGKLIGYASYHKQLHFWCGYCIVPEKWFLEFLEYDEDYPGIPEITYSNSSEFVIGWDHAHVEDLYKYSNLYNVMTEIWDVWKVTHEKCSL